MDASDFEKLYEAVVTRYPQIDQAKDCDDYEKSKKKNLLDKSYKDHSLRFIEKHLSKIDTHLKSIITDDFIERLLKCFNVRLSRYRLEKIYSSTCKEVGWNAWVLCANVDYHSEKGYENAKKFILQSFKEFPCIFDRRVFAEKLKIGKKNCLGQFNVEFCHPRNLDQQRFTSDSHT